MERAKAAGVKEKEEEEEAATFFGAIFQRLLGVYISFGVVRGGIVEFSGVKECNEPCGPMALGAPGLLGFAHGNPCLEGSKAGETLAGGVGVLFCEPKRSPECPKS